MSAVKEGGNRPILPLSRSDKKRNYPPVSWSNDTIGKKSPSEMGTRVVKIRRKSVGKEK